MKVIVFVGARKPLKNSGSHIDASHSRQPLVKGERLVRYEVNAVMSLPWLDRCLCFCVAHYRVFSKMHLESKTNHLLQKQLWHLLPRRVCYTRLSAMPGQHVQGHEQAQGHTAPIKNSCDKQVSSWRHISCHTDKNRYYT